MRSDHCPRASRCRSMASDPLVSVLVPAFNDAAFLAEALDSVLAQDVYSLEVIVSDDASTDGTLDVARAYAARDGRVRVLVNAENLGMTRNWNRALAEARGEFVLKLDADDAIKPGTLGQMLEAM